MAFVPSITNNIIKCDNYTTPIKAFLNIKPYKPTEYVKIYDPFYNEGKSKEYLQEVFSDCEIIHAYISSLDYNKLSDGDKRKIAKEMGHSLIQQSRYRFI